MKKNLVKLKLTKLHPIKFLFCIRILWGNHTDSLHHMVCLDDQESSWTKTIKLSSQPLVFDYDADYISDLLVVEADGNRNACYNPLYIGSIPLNNSRL